MAQCGISQAGHQQRPRARGPRGAEPQLDFRACADFQSRRHRGQPPARFRHRPRRLRLRRGSQQRQPQHDAPAAGARPELPHHFGGPDQRQSQRWIHPPRHLGADQAGHRRATGFHQLLHADGLQCRGPALCETQQRTLLAHRCRPSPRDQSPAARQREKGHRRFMGQHLHPPAGPPLWRRRAQHPPRLPRSQGREIRCFEQPAANPARLGCGVRERQFLGNLLLQYSPRCVIHPVRRGPDVAPRRHPERVQQLERQPCQPQPPSPPSQRIYPRTTGR